MSESSSSLPKQILITPSVINSVSGTASDEPEKEAECYIKVEVVHEVIEYYKERVEEVEEEIQQGEITSDEVLGELVSMLIDLDEALVSG